MAKRLHDAQHSHENVEAVEAEMAGMLTAL